MAILYVRDENGKFVSIPAIVGPQGPQGPAGTDIDLSNYPTKEEVDSKIDEKLSAITNANEVSY